MVGECVPVSVSGCMSVLGKGGWGDTFVLYSVRGIEIHEYVFH